MNRRSRYRDGMTTAALQVVGLVLLGAACWMVTPPLGLAVTGAVLLLFGVVREVRG